MSKQKKNSKPAIYNISEVHRRLQAYLIYFILNLDGKYMSIHYIFFFYFRLKQEMGAIRCSETDLFKCWKSEIM